MVHIDHAHLIQMTCPGNNHTGSAGLRRLVAVHRHNSATPNVHIGQRPADMVSGMDIPGERAASPSPRIKENDNG